MRARVDPRPADLAADLILIDRGISSLIRDLRDAPADVIWTFGAATNVRGRFDILISLLEETRDKLPPRAAA